jgi:lactate dehydrogenase-like 2-hydroxyacid dehydrogenase
MLAGGLCGIFGFGGIGAATGRLMYSLGMRVHAINRHGRTDKRVDSMPGGLSRYGTESSASINRFSTCSPSHPPVLT